MSLFGLFKKTTETPEVSFQTFAHFPLYQLMNEAEPFDDWKDPKTKVPKDLEQQFKVAVWMYQMWVFYLLTAHRFDYEIADRALRLQVDKLEELSPEMAEQLELAITGIQSTLEDDAKEPHIVKDMNGEMMEVPVEYKLAIQFLTQGDDCPFPASDGVPEFNDADVQLASCLEHGREAARAYFEPGMSAIKVVL